MAVKWFFVPAERAAPRIRLVCLPYAGATAAAFREWPGRLPEDVEVLAVQLPGRGWRMREPPLRDIATMADRVTEALDAVEGPLALFGHSMGAWVSFEIARRLTRRGRVPRILLASGRQAPALGSRTPPMSHLDDRAFVETVQTRYGGIPREIRADPDLLELLLPILRTDVAALERYRYGAGEPLPCPIVALGGRQDPRVPTELLTSWAEETSAGFRARSFPGGHFYLNDPGSGFFEAVARELAGDRPGGP